MSSTSALSSVTATPTIPLTGPRIRRARQASAARAAIERRLRRQLARQHTPRGWEWLALWIALAPHRLLPSRLSCRWSDFWDTWAVAHPTNWALRPKLRRGLAIERRRVLAALRAVLRASARASWPQTSAAADARWRAEVRDLLETLSVVVEATEDHWGAVHFQTRDLTCDHRAALTQPSLDAVLLAADDPGASTALTRPHDASTQPALAVVRPAVR